LVAEPPRWLALPRLAGASTADRLRAGAGALCGVALAALLSGLAAAALGLAGPTATLMLVAPIGASAVLVFAVPASPLAQPWAVLGGNVVSAGVGMMVAALVPVPALAAGVAVGAAIAAMTILRCLHPPGGAAALTAVLGSPLLAATGPWFPLLPVGLNSLLLVLAGLAFHRLTGHPYPHRPSAPVPALLHRADIDAALAEMGEALDVDPDDLEELLNRAEAHAQRQSRRR
jgi:CBS domain-containing membrane protein